MSLPCRIARGALARGSNLRTASRWTVPSTAKIVSLGAKCVMSTTTTSGGSLLTKLATDNPYKDVVRYEHKNRKWNLQHVDYYSEALAIGLLENGLQPGDVVLSWLSPHFSESVSSKCERVNIVF
jgi:hypothetical protein